MFIEVHLLQNFAPANLNRDDNNNPKDCEFGGVRRARISSQCIKRAIRRSPEFAQATTVPIGIRTKWLVNMLNERLAEAGKPTDESLPIVKAFVESYMSQLDAKVGKQDKNITAVLVYVGSSEIEEMAKALLEEWNDLKGENSKQALATITRNLIKERKGWTSVPDIALFGRMLAEQPELNLEAACQLAHAISTHRVTMEMDFYTAVDDLKPEDTAGAGMVGFVGYDSACFYRYARLDWEQLVKNLKGDVPLARRTVEGFLRATMAAVPTGKQNSFAANNPPSLALAAVREQSMGWSLANAFEQPVRATRDGGLVAPSVEKLDHYWGCLCQIYGTASLRRVAVLALDDLPLTNLREHRVPNLDAWVQAIIAELPTK